MDRMQPVMDQRPRILLVYANSDDAVRCSRCLRRQGWAVHMAASGEEALLRIRELPLTAVVIDLDLPRTEVDELCAEISCAHPNLPIFLVTDESANEEEGELHFGVGTLVSRSVGIQGLTERVLSVATA